MTAVKNLNERINSLDWVAKNEVQWRTTIKTLKDYRDRLKEDLLNDRVAHLDVYIQEMEEARSSQSFIYQNQKYRNRSGFSRKVHATVSTRTTKIV